MTGISPLRHQVPEYLPQARQSVSRTSAPASTEATPSSHTAEMAANGVPVAVNPTPAAQGEQDGGVGLALERREAEMNVLEAKKALPCETCRTRKYQDGSDDGGVSFQTPTHIDPNNAASVVLGHEYEHVKNEQLYAEQDGREVISQSVTLHTGICPECGRMYVAGGETRTTTAAKDSATAYNQEAAVGQLLDAIA